MANPEPKPSFLALLPLLIFLAIFMGCGVFYTLQGQQHAFYLIPGPVAILPAIVVAILLNRQHKETTHASIEQFIRGAGDSNIIAMCLIFLLAGAFAAVTTAIGSVESTVNLGLNLVPQPLLIPGLFVVSALVALAMGTSVGTIATLGPIAFAVAKHSGGNLALFAGSLLSGAMFGDNLSLISDTTIAATRTQGAAMRDKFLENLKLVLPAALMAAIVYAVFPTGEHNTVSGDYQILLILPYLFILVLAILGMNVFAVLAVGIISAAVIGIYSMPSYTAPMISANLMEGFANSQSIMLLSLFIGGLSALVERQGGMEYLKTKLMRLIQTLQQRSKKDNDQQLAQLAIALLVSVTNVFTANNTVAIVVVGGVAKDIASKHQVPARRSASILDIFSCVVQGLIPYGFQILLLAQQFNISPLSISQYAVYPLLLAAVALVAIFKRSCPTPKVARNNATS